MTVLLIFRAVLVMILTCSMAKKSISYRYCLIFILIFQLFPFKNYVYPSQSCALLFQSQGSYSFPSTSIVQKGQGFRSLTTSILIRLQYPVFVLVCFIALMSIRQFPSENSLILCQKQRLAAVLDSGEYSCQSSSCIRQQNWQYYFSETTSETGDSQTFMCQRYLSQGNYFPLQSQWILHTIPRENNLDLQERWIWLPFFQAFTLQIGQFLYDPSYQSYFQQKRVSHFMHQIGSITIPKQIRQVRVYLSYEEILVAI